MTGDLFSSFSLCVGVEACQFFVDIYMYEYIGKEH